MKSICNIYVILIIRYYIDIQAYKSCNKIFMKFFEKKLQKYLVDSNTRCIFTMSKQLQTNDTMSHNGDSTIKTELKTIL